MKLKNLILSFFIMVNLVSIAQNLVVNPSFELGSPPTAMLHNFNNGLVTDWTAGFTKTGHNEPIPWTFPTRFKCVVNGNNSPDIFDQTSADCRFDVPSNIGHINLQERRNKKRYAGFFGSGASTGTNLSCDDGESIFGKLSTPVSQPGNYYVSFWATRDFQFVNCNNANSITTRTNLQTNYQVQVTIYNNTTGAQKVVFVSPNVNNQNNWQCYSGYVNITAQDVAQGFDRIELREFSPHSKGNGFDYTYFDDIYFGIPCELEVDFEMKNEFCPMDAFTFLSKYNPTNTAAAVTNYTLTIIENTGGIGVGSVLFSGMVSDKLGLIDLKDLCSGFEVGKCYDVWFSANYTCEDITCEMPSPGVLAKTFCIVECEGESPCCFDIPAEICEGMTLLATSDCDQENLYYYDWEILEGGELDNQPLNLVHTISTFGFPVSERISVKDINFKDHYSFEAGKCYTIRLKRYKRGLDGSIQMETCEKMVCVRAASYLMDENIILELCDLSDCIEYTPNPVFDGFSQYYELTDATTNNLLYQGGIATHCLTAGDYTFKFINKNTCQIKNINVTVNLALPYMIECNLGTIHPACDPYSFTVEELFNAAYQVSNAECGCTESGNPEWTDGFFNPIDPSLYITLQFGESRTFRKSFTDEDQCLICSYVFTVECNYTAPPPAHTNVKTNSLISQENRSLDISIVPNPTSSIFTLMPENKATRFEQVEIMDVTGKVLLSYQNIEREKEYDLSHFKKGHYLIRIQSGNGFKVLKLFLI